MQKRKKVLYVSGEESAGQIKLRANRLDANHNELFINEIKLEEIMEELLKLIMKFVLLTQFKQYIPGHLTQVLEVFHKFERLLLSDMRKAKESNIAMFIIGHITKDGKYYRS